MLGHHIAYTVQHEGLPPVEYDVPTAGDTVEITGDMWQVAEVDHRTHVLLERPTGAAEEGNRVREGA
ncbi:hypothetical protein [Streptomyces sp. NPDC005009]